MKKFLMIPGIVILGLVILILAKNAIIKSTVCISATAVTGAPTSIGSLDMSFLKQSVHIKNFKMLNPKGFPRETFIDIPEIEAAVDIGALLKGKLHVKKVALNLNELVVIRNKEGQLNVDALKVSSQAGEKKEEKPAAKKQEMMPMQIDEINLNVGRVVSKDYTKGTPPKTDVYESNLKNKTFKNITSAQQLVTLILAESLKGTAITGAKIFAANAVLGVAFLPAGVAITLLGKDSAQKSLDVPADKTYDGTMQLLKEMADRATIKKEDKAAGVISALVDKNDVTIKVAKVTDKSSKLTVSARRLMLPKPEVAQGLIQQISEKLK